MSPPSTSGDSTRLAHLRALDGLRGVAVLAVVLYHFSPEKAPGGFLGVDVFFVLSGFLITSLLVKEWEKTRAISFGRFWLRRARRLLPALFLVLAAVGVYALIQSDHAQAHKVGEDGLATLGYFANWHFITSGQSYVERIVQFTPSPLRHAWSLAIEEQFYVIWPLVVGLVTLAVARHRHRFRIALTVTCVALGAASFVRMVTLYHSTSDANRVYYGTDTRAFLLLLGAALGALTSGSLSISRRNFRVALIVAGCIAAAAIAVLMAEVPTTDTWLYKGGYGGVAVLIAIVLVAAAQPGVNPVGRVLELRPLVGLGLISYGVYLWHWPITVWLTAERTSLTGPALFALRAAVTLAASLASYVLVEQPIRQGRLPRWRGLHPVVVPAVVLVALAALIAAPVVAYPTVNEIPKVAPSKRSTPVSVTYANVPRCDQSKAIKPTKAAKGLRVQLFGNSIAVEVKDCLGTIVGAHGATFESVVQSGVAPCHILPRLRAQVEKPARRPDVAIFSAAYLDKETTCAPELVDWFAQVRAALDIWMAAGTHVYLVPIVPNVPGTGDPLPAEGAPYVPAQTPEFTALAEQDPAHITVIDAGMFIRDAKGVYQWRMPCVPGGEQGCDSDHTIGVRWVDGFHFCAASNWNGHSCAPTDSGGERRVAAAIALQIREL